MELGVLGFHDCHSATHSSIHAWFRTLLLAWWTKAGKSLFCYRTPMSMKNRETWAFAHICAGKTWWSMGKFVLLIPLGVMLPLWGESTETIGWFGAFFCVIQCIPLLAVIPITERQLHLIFDKDGSRKSEQ